MSKKKKKKGIGLIILHIVVFILALTWLYPYIWMFINAFKKTSDIFTTSLISGPFTLENFKFLLASSDKMNRPFLLALGNSIFITVIVVFFVMLTTTITGYALTKFEFRGRKAFQGFIIFQMMFPAFLFMVPLFVLIRSTYLLNTYSAMFLPYVMSAYAVFLAVQSFRGTPDDFIEAARIDGAGEVWISFKIMAPLNRSIMAIIAITTFNGIWDNFIWPLIVIQDYNKMPFSVLIATFAKSYATYVGPILAGTVIQSLPMMIVFLICRKYVFEGINVSLK